MTLPRLITVCVLIGAASLSSLKSAQKPTNRDLEIASRFAPIFYQALGDKPRNDFITNFDFDGDWRGDNNWNNAANKDFPLKAYIYFSVSETATHFFIHYAVYHPRDYKGGERRGAILSQLIREGAKHGGKYDPTGLADEATLAHENDMEGALVVVEKDGNDLSEAHVAFVETLHHNNFSHYRPGDPQEGVARIKLESRRPLLYVEPKGHGIESFDGDEKQTTKKTFLRYVYAGRADNPAQGDFVCGDLEKTPCNKSVGYQLLPLAGLWAKAATEPNQTYGVVFDYGEIKLMTSLTTGETKERGFKLGTLGCAFLGKVGGVNMARPPWGWFDRDERDQKLGLWFFDPATVIKKDFKLDEKFSTAYVRLPFWAKN